MKPIALTLALLMQSLTPHPMNYQDGSLIVEVAYLSPLPGSPCVYRIEMYYTCRPDAPTCQAAIDFPAVAERTYDSAVWCQVPDASPETAQE